MHEIIILLALCGQTQDQLKQHDEITGRWAQMMSPTSVPTPPTRIHEQYHHVAPERTTRQKIDDGRAQYLREKWLTQTLVTEKTTNPYRIQHIKNELAQLSSKEVLNIQKELDRRARIRATQIASARARYHRQQRAYYWWGPRGYTFRYGTYRRR